MPEENSNFEININTSDRTSAEKIFAPQPSHLKSDELQILAFDSSEGVQSLNGLFLKKLKELHQDDTKSLQEKTNEALLYAFCLVMTTKLRYLYPNYPSADPIKTNIRREALATVLSVIKKHLLANIHHRF